MENSQLLNPIINSLPKLMTIYSDGHYRNSLYYACIINEKGMYLNSEDFFLGYGICNIDKEHSDWPMKNILKWRWKPYYDVFEFKKLKKLSKRNNLGFEAEILNKLLNAQEDFMASADTSNRLFPELLMQLGGYMKEHFRELFKEIFISDDFLVLVKPGENGFDEIPEVEFPISAKAYISLKKSVEQKKSGEDKFDAIMKKIGDASLLSMEEFNTAFNQLKLELGY